MFEDSLAMKIWKVIYPPILYLGISIAVQIIASIVIVCVRFYQLKTAGSMLSIGHSVEFITGITNDILQYSTVITLVSALITLAVFYKLFKGKKSFKFNRNISKDYLYVVGLGILASTALSRLIGLLPVDNVIGNYDEISQVLFSGNIGLQFITIAVAAPILEEIIFRGLVYNRLKEYMGGLTAAVVSALFFGIYHMNLVQGIYAFFVGILLVYVYEKYKNITAPILMHGAANAFSIFLTHTSISERLSENMAVYILFMVVEFAGMYVFLRLIDKKIIHKIDDTEKLGG